jgi:uncharacterized protein (DUF362 family)
MRFGDVEYLESVGKKSFMRLVSQMSLKPPVLIKPNWGSSFCFTEADILDWTLSSIKGEKIVIESYGWARTQEFITTGNMGSKRKSDLRRSDKWFLEYSGIGEVLEKHNIEFLNITEEKWHNRLTDSEYIKGLVETKYDPVAIDKMYGEVPQKLYEMQGATLLSLAKLKIGFNPFPVSLAVKNLFGMIPGPGRWVPYHGRKNSQIAQSVLDINKVYHSLFDVKGVIEAVFSAEAIEKGMKGSEILKDLGLAWASQNVFELDAFVSAQFDRPPDEVQYLKHTADHLGKWSKKIVELGYNNSLSHLLPVIKN